MCFHFEIIDDVNHYVVTKSTSSKVILVELALQLEISILFQGVCFSPSITIT